MSKKKRKKVKVKEKKKARAKERKGKKQAREVKVAKETIGADCVATQAIGEMCPNNQAETNTTAETASTHAPSAATAAQTVTGE